MAVTRLWLRTDLRRRFRSAVMLVILVTLATTAVLVALSGARRGDTALDRLLERTLPTDAVVLPNTPGFDWSKVERLPEVETLTGFAVDYAIAAQGFPPEVMQFPPTDANTFSTIERPVVQRGRTWNPRRADEVVVSRNLARNFHLDVGDHVTLQLPTAKERADPDFQGALHGPRVRASIVGVVVSPWFGDYLPSFPGQIVVSPGLAKQYPDQVIGDQTDPEGAGVVNALVRLKGGEAALPAFRRDLARVTHRDIDVWNMSAQYRSVQRTLTFEAICLAIFALVVLVAACFLVGQSIGRHTAAAAEELRTATLLGMTRSEGVRNAALVPFVAGVLGVALAVPICYFVSDRFPLGIAEVFEPHPGRSFDWVVLGPGIVGLIALVGAAAWFSARRAFRVTDRVPRRSSVLDVMRGGRWPIPVMIGTRFALDPGRGRASVPVRRAVFGAVLGLAGIVGAMTFGAAVHDASSNPDRFGQTFDVGAGIGYNGQGLPPSRVTAALSARPEVDGVLVSRMGVVGDPAGRSSVSVFTYAPGSKPIDTVMLSGRMPRTAGEVVLGPSSLESLGTKVGARITLVGDRGRGSYRVTGVGFLPKGPHNGYADGAWMTPAGYDRVLSGFKFEFLLARTRPGTSLAALTKSVVKRDPSLQGLELTKPDPLDEVATLQDVESLPSALGLFLMVLALAAVGHALALSVRRRSGDLAVMRALGMTPWQCRGVVVTQSTVLALIGLLFGLPLGVALGRFAWRVVADYTPLAYVAPFPTWTVLLVIPAALLAANLLGIWPGRRAARLSVPHLLRTE